VSDYSRDVMFRIIDYRCNNNMMTFITSNLSPVQLAGIFHERFVKRLGNICAIIEVSGNAIGVLRT
jgi:DNA replication protein DnaC